MRRFVQYTATAVVLSCLFAACGSEDESVESSQVIDLQRPSALVVSVPSGSSRATG